MLLQIHPKLPMTNKVTTRKYYEKLGFEPIADEYPEYLMMEKDDIELHFFLFESLNKYENYGMVYIRVGEIEELYKSIEPLNLDIPELGKLQRKPWGQMEFSLRDPDMNLLTFGQEFD